MYTVQNVLDTIPVYWLTVFVLFYLKYFLRIIKENILSKTVKDKLFYNYY